MRRFDQINAVGRNTRTNEVSGATSVTRNEAFSFEEGLCMENKKVETYQDLIVWQMSHELTLQIFKLCQKLRKDEQAFLVDHLRSSVSQIPINIALGFKRRGKTAKMHYYRAAVTALEESNYYLTLSKELGYLKEDQELKELIENLEKKMKGLLRSIASSK